MESIVLLVVGWLLGLLSPAIIEQASRRKHKKDVLASLRIEFSEIVRLQSIVVMAIGARRGDLNKDLLTYLIKMREKHDVEPLDNDSRITLQTMKEYYSMNDKELKEINDLYSSDKQQAYHYRKLRVPYLESKFDKLNLFPERFQKGVYEIIKQVEYFNDLAEDAKYYYSLSFDSSLTPKALNALLSSYQENMADIERRSKLILEKVDAIDLEKVN